MTGQVHVLEDAAAVAAEVAARLLARLADLTQHGEAPVHVVLTGGTVADAVHRETARRLEAGAGVAWDRVHLWFGDERFVAEDSDDRNALQARRALTGRLEELGVTVHEVAGTGSASSPEEAAALYADELAAHGVDVFDLLMLGIGPDGHVASLFPGNPALDASGSTAGVHDSPKPPPLRVTLTFERLNRTRETWFMATGGGKADAVAAALHGVGHPLPVQRVGLTGDVEWFLDAEAAPLREEQGGH